MTDTEFDALEASLEKRALVMTDDPVYRRALDAIAALRMDLKLFHAERDALRGDNETLRYMLAEAVKALKDIAEHGVDTQ